MPVHAQLLSTGFDSIPVVRLAGNQPSYRFGLPLIGSVQLIPGTIIRSTEPASDKRKNGYKKFLLPGKINFNEQESGTILLQGQWKEIKSLELGPKENRRGDIRISKFLHHTWDKGANAYLINTSDTTGFFNIALRAYEEPQYQYWTKPFLQDIFTGESAASMPENEFFHEGFGLMGAMHGKKIIVLHNSRFGVSWIFQDSTLLAIWKSDNSQIRGNQNTSNASISVPYLLLNPVLEADQKGNIVRLVLTIGFIEEALVPGRFIPR